MSLPAEAQRMRAQVHAAIDAPPSRATANRRNAQHSTGPASPAGKSVSCLNALKTGLTGRTVLLHADDVAQYREHLAAYEAEYRPHGLRKRELVQSLADTQWRLARIPGLEMALYATNRATIELSTPNRVSPFDANFCELDTFLKYERELRNLHLQEARLLRRFEKERNELRTLQAARQPQTDESHPAEQAVPTPPTNGFEFSNAPSAAAAPAASSVASRKNSAGSSQNGRPDRSALAPSFLPPHDVLS